MPDDKLGLRSRLIRRVLELREMLPGSIVENQTKCGKQNCKCVDGKRLHSRFVLSLLMDGEHKTFHVSAGVAEEISKRVEMHRRYQGIGAEICKINLDRFLKERKR